MKSIISPVLSNGCETWPLTLRKEHGLRVFENVMLKRMFGRKREELAAGLERITQL